MFSRRHPFLFFILILFSLFTVLVVGLSGIALVTSSVFEDKVGAEKYDSKGNVGIIEVKGVITSSKKVLERIKEFREDNAIKAIVVRIDSPGGAIGPSQEIYREILKTRDKKIIVASLGSVAASGGYYIASAANKIVANPGTITGSIGVIMEYANIREILDKIGLSPVVIKSGEYKDMGSPVRELTENEKALMQDLVDELHVQFVNDAARGRGLSRDHVAGLADGRIYTGQSALELELVDRMGNFEDSIQWTGKLAGIKGEIRPVYPKPDRMTIIRKIVESLLEDIDITGAVSDNFRYIIN